MNWNWSYFGQQLLPNVLKGLVGGAIIGWLNGDIPTVMVIGGIMGIVASFIFTVTHEQGTKKGALIGAGTGLIACVVLGIGYGVVTKEPSFVFVLVLAVLGAFIGSIMGFNNNKKQVSDKS
jgi:hypothetical protein